jgi:hypothetical protein
MFLSAIKWLSFAWGCLAVAVMGYYAARWFPYAPNLRANELGIMIGAFYGWPSWLALPAIAYTQRRDLPGWQIALLVSPVLVAVALYATAWFLTSGGR